MAVTGVGNYNSIYEDVYASSRRETVKKEETKKAANTGAAKKNEAKLSSKAQDFLKNLRKQYGDYDFLVGNSTDDLKALAKSGSKEFSVVFSNAELERMASDEKYADEKLNCMEQAVKMSEEINKKYGFQQALGKGNNAEITKIGIVFNDDGTTSYFAELEKTSAKQRERIEKSREDKRTGKKQEEKRAEKEMRSYTSGNKDTKRTNVQANSMEELLDKILAVDWNDVKSEEMQKSGRKFDFSI